MINNIIIILLSRKWSVNFALKISTDVKDCLKCFSAAGTLSARLVSVNLSALMNSPVHTVDTRSKSVKMNTRQTISLFSMLWIASVRNVRKRVFQNTTGHSIK